MRLPRIILALFLCVFLSFAVFASPIFAQSATIGAAELEAELADFFGKGAVGYYVWQYSGDSGAAFPEADKFSFFRDTPSGAAVCATLKKAASMYPGKDIGVNIRSAGVIGNIGDHLTWLKNECGVNAIRVFARHGGIAGMQNVLAAANGKVKVIIAVGDFVVGWAANPGPDGIDKAWYRSGYKTAFRPFASQLVAALAGSDRSALAGMEIMNEPHCKGDISAIDAYRAWANDIGGILKRASSNVGIGQMASQDGTRCDSPRPGDFTITNGVSVITMTSAHYYNADEKASALAALAASQGLGKPFYIGEASFGEIKGAKTGSLYIFPGIDDQVTKEAKFALASRYMLTCAPQITLAAGTINDDLLTRPSEPTKYVNWISPTGADVCPNDDRCVVPFVAGELKINYGKTTIPLFRLQNAQVPAPNSTTRRRDDLEGFFASTYTNTQRDLTTQLVQPLANGVSTKLTSQFDRCRNTVSYLHSIKKLCDQDQTFTRPKINSTSTTPSTTTPLPPQEGCGLNLEIPGSPGGYATYLDVERAIPADYCNRPPSATPFSQAFSAIETTLPHGFKPAYIVRYFDVPPTDPFYSGSVGSLPKMQNWFGPAGPGNRDGLAGLKARIKVTKVLVPANFTVRNDDPLTGANLGASDYNSGFMQTMQAVMSVDEQAAIKKQKEDQIKTVFDRGNYSVTSPDMFNPNPDPNNDERVQCWECAGAPDSLEAVLVRRINAEWELFSQGWFIDLLRYLQTRERDGMVPNCSEEQLVGEKAATIKQQIDPDGNPDPTQPDSVKLTAHVVAKKDPRGRDVKVRTYLLLPEEYRDVSLHELPFMDRFIPYDLKKTVFFTTFEGDRNNLLDQLLHGKRDVAYKYLQMSGTTSGLDPNGTPVKEGAEIGQYLSAAQNPDGSPMFDGAGNPVSIGGDPTYLKATITGSDKNIPDPLVPGGRLARSIWEIMCNVTRPFDGTPTRPYPGLEQFLQKGVAACTEGMSHITPSSTTTPPANICSGTTTVPPNKDWAALYAIFERASNAVFQAKGVTIPAKFLYGIFRIEGTPTYNAFFFNRGGLACRPNSIGVMGPMSIMVGACGGPYSTFEENAAQLGLTNASPCNLEQAAEIAAWYFVRNMGPTGFNRTNPTDADWAKLLCSYNGINSSCPASVGGCTSSTNPTGNYGICAVEFSKKFGIPQL